MPFEIHAVLPLEMTKGINCTTITTDRSPDVSAIGNLIKHVYEEVDQRGGEIVGSHSVEPYRGAEAVLYLVAKYPEAE